MRENRYANTDVAADRPEAHPCAAKDVVAMGLTQLIVTIGKVQRDSVSQDVDVTSKIQARLVARNWFLAIVAQYALQDQGVTPPLVMTMSILPRAIASSDAAVTKPHLIVAVRIAPKVIILSNAMRSLRAR